MPIDKNISLKNWTKEVELTGTELTEFQEKVAQKRKEKLLAKVRDQKNQNILSADTVDSEDSSDDDDEGDNEAEKQKGNTSSNLLIKQYQNINVADSNVALTKSTLLLLMKHSSQIILNKAWKRTYPSI